jgi:uncharacterized protein
MVVWRLCDGKAGHERQTAGLVAELARRRSIEVFDIDVRNLRVPVFAHLRPPTPVVQGLPPPTLLVGAGRACQWPLLVARRAHGGRAVYCMKPTWPARWFDWCLIPQHDGVTRSAHVEPTFGVLNDLSVAVDTPADRSLILVGGPSRHYHWDEELVLKQLGSLVFGRRSETLIISDSRRTPTSTFAKLRSFQRPGVEVVSHQTTSPAWLTQTLGGVARVWVTADSVSMMFEVLTAGRALGVLDVRARRRDRITRIAPDLVERKFATSFNDWVGGEILKAPIAPIAEAARCADLLLSRWFDAA